VIVSNENGTDSRNATINVLNNTKPPTTEPNGKVEWGSSVIYGPGNSNSISLDDSGHCVEVHVRSGRLYYRVGKVNFDNKTIGWET
jgi:hypothetical protein